jgi:hypothetical protein
MAHVTWVKSHWVTADYAGTIGLSKAKARSTPEAQLRFAARPQNGLHPEVGDSRESSTLADFRKQNEAHARESHDDARSTTKHTCASHETHSASYEAHCAGRASRFVLSLVCFAQLATGGKPWAMASTTPRPM